MGEVTVATTIRDIILISEKGERVKLLNIHIPSAKRNLLSTNRFTQIGAELFANKERMLIKKDSMGLTLESTRCGNTGMYYLRAKRVGHEVNDVASASENTTNADTKVLKSIDINAAHGLCHLGEKLLQIMKINLNVKLTGTLLP